MMEPGGERRILWVFVDGEAAPAEIQVDLRHNIHGLKKVIKAECDLHNVAPSNMILWKLEDNRVSLKPEQTLSERLRSQRHDFSIRLDSGSKVLDVFPQQPSDDYLHIFVVSHVSERHPNKERLQLETREREEPHLCLTAKVITDKTFARHDGFDLATFGAEHYPPSDLPTFSVLKQEHYTTFKSRLALHFEYHEDQIRLWILGTRQNKTSRPYMPIPENVAALTVGAVRSNMTPTQNDLRLYLDVIPDLSKPDIPPQSVMVFLKHFDTWKQTLCGVGKVYIQKMAKVADLVPLINERMSWISGTPLRFYEEIKPGMTEFMKLNLTFYQCEIQDGDIICFQIDLPETAVGDLEKRGFYSNPIKFYQFLQTVDHSE